MVSSGTAFGRFRWECWSIFRTNFRGIAFFMNRLPDFIEFRGLNFHRLVADGTSRKF
jgi:hypothetical protein